MSSPYSLFGLIIRGKEKNSLSPRAISFLCMTACMGTVLLLISAMALISPLPYLLPPQEGWGRGWRRLSEVTSLINKLARHTSARRAICSQLVLCGGETEQSHNLWFVYSGVQPLLLTHAGKAWSQKQETAKFMSLHDVCCVSRCLWRPQFVLVVLFIHLTGTMQSNMLHFHFP